MTAADIMTETVRAVRPDEPVAAALDLLQSSESRHLPVVDDGGALVGLLSDRDLRALLGWYDSDEETLQRAQASEAAQRPVSDIMTRNVLTLGLDDDVEDIIEHLLDEKVGALPVVDEDEKLVGIVSYIDVLRAWHRELQGDLGPTVLPNTVDLEARSRVEEGQAVAPRPPRR